MERRAMSPTSASVAKIVPGSGTGTISPLVKIFALEPRLPLPLPRPSSHPKRAPSQTRKP